MNEEELRQYCKDASLEISNMQHTIDNLQQENKQLKEEIKRCEKANVILDEISTELQDKLTEIKKIIDSYMPNEHAMCKAFDEIKFIIKEAKKEER